MEGSKMKNYCATIVNSEESRDKKFLVVGESHYLDKDSEHSKSIDKARGSWIEDRNQLCSEWYQLGTDAFFLKYGIDSERKGWMDTEMLFNDVYERLIKEPKVEYRKSRKNREMFTRVAEAMAIQNEDENVTNEDIAKYMKHYDFLNYYIRPNLWARNYEATKLDKQISWDNFKELISDKEYQAIIVLSAKIRDEIQKQLKKSDFNVPCEIVYLNHTLGGGWSKQDEGNWKSLVTFLCITNKE